MSRDFSDQTKILDPAKFAFPVHLIGGGGIGSPLVQLLAKMGIPELHLWDDDVFEKHNGPAEIAYSEALVGLAKVEVAKATVEFLVGEGTLDFVMHRERVTNDTALSGVVISGVDSMRSRAEIWECIQNNFLEIPFYMDARSAGEEILILSFSPMDFDHVAEYTEDWMYADSEASTLECGARNIGYVANAIAAEVGRNLTRFYRNLPIEFNIAKDLSKN